MTSSRRLGDNAAIVTYDAIVREAPEEDQGPPPRYQHFSSVWMKQGDQWKLKFHQIHRRRTGATGDVIGRGAEESESPFSRYLSLAKSARHLLRASRKSHHL